MKLVGEWNEVRWTERAVWVQDICFFLQSVLEFGGKSGCMEILDTLWEGAVSWGIARDVSAKYQEIFWDAGSRGQTRPQHWIQTWDISGDLAKRHANGGQRVSPAHILARRLKVWLYGEHRMDLWVVTCRGVPFVNRVVGLQWLSDW